MTYKELQTALRQFKAEGLTDIKLNASQEILQAEYDQVIERLEIDKMMIELEGFTTKEVLGMIGNIEKTLETYGDINSKQKTINLAVDRYIEIMEKTLLAEFNCNYKIEKSEITKNKHKTVKEVLKTIARKTGINELDFRNVLQENVGNYFYDLVLTGYEYYCLDYCLELFAAYLSEIETTEETALKTPPVLEIVTPENDPSFDTATQYSVDAINDVFKRFGSANFITKETLRLSIINDVTVNDFIKFLNLNSGISLRDFMDSLESHLISKYQFTAQYWRYSLKSFLQDFTTHIENHKLVA